MSSKHVRLFIDHEGQTDNLTLQNLSKKRRKGDISRTADQRELHEEMTVVGYYRPRHIPAVTTKDPCSK